MKYVSFLTAAALFALVACRSHAAPSEVGACKSVVRNARLIINQYDHDHDGRLSQSELRAMANDLDSMARRTNKQFGAEGGEDNFAQLRARDTNHDGYIDLSEFAILPDKDGVWRSCLRR